MNLQGAASASVTSSGRSQLPGGTANRGLVVRVGATVRRPQHEGSAAIHHLLLHLENVGFDGAPRYLGEDDQGREVLSYIDGEAAIEPYPAWSKQDDALVSVARLLRRYHARRCDLRRFESSLGILCSPAHTATVCSVTTTPTSTTSSSGTVRPWR